MNLRKTWGKWGILICSFIALTSCKEDLDYLESDLINQHNFSGVIDSLSTVVAYSVRANSVQTNGLPVNMLGLYNDPVYGWSNANVLTQLTLENPDPDFGNEPLINKVTLSIPYFSTAEAESEDGTTAYQLDSLYGNQPIKLSVYESNYFLRDYDPNTGYEELQKYYSNQNSIFENFLGTLIYEKDEFVPSNDEIVLNEGEENDEGESLEERLSPRMYVELDSAFFAQKILTQAGTDNLLNNNNFREYFRGLYFKTEAVSGSSGNYFLFNLEDASIEMEYTFLPDGAENESERDTAVLNFSFNGIRVNTINTDVPQSIEATLDNPNTEFGEENLYLKGGDGAVAIIDMFGDDVDGDGEPDELTNLKDKNILINDAFLEFYVNQDMVSGGSSEPERIFIYDLKNRQILLDYIIDNYTPESDPLNYKTNHLGRLERNADGQGIKYKIRLTNYINSLVNKDSTNLQLGLSVNHNVALTGFRSIEQSASPGFENLPTGSVISPKGTVLHGSNSPNADKRLKLYIYYTEVND